MRIPLFDFQKEAKEKLSETIRMAHTLLNMSNAPQIISFSAPTGAGKTIIMTSLIEDIFFGTDISAADPNSIFVWISDMPDLNEQSKEKIEKKSDRIRISQLITLDSNYDKELLEQGNIYFLNTQKIGSDKLLTQKSDKRANTIWEMFSNTARKYRNNFYIVIDEAHRGMNRGANTTKNAQSIMQKFILGSPTDGLDIMPLIIGITATPHRFQSLISETTATTHKVVVKPEDVVESGLIKDRVIIHCPDRSTNAEMTMFQNAVTRWKDICKSWEEYHYSEGEKLIKPILVIQVDDKSLGFVTNTDIKACIEILKDSLGRKLVDGEVVHTFKEKETLQGFEIPIRKIEPSRIEEDDRVLAVFFKMNLSTGWDCPRAEVMMSFRTANDYTYIAQLLGRMVRTPLAHRIEMDATLNAVHLFLPYFNQETVEDVVKALKEDESVPSAETGTEKELVTLFRNKEFNDVFDQMNNLITYRVEGVRKQSNLRRLDHLSILLSNDEINLDSRKFVREKMMTKISEELESMRSESIYNELAKRFTDVRLQTFELNLDTKRITPEMIQTIDVEERDVDLLYHKAEKIIGDYVCKHYRKVNTSGDPLEQKIELIVLASDVTTMDSIEKYAGELFDQSYNKHIREIQQLHAAKRTKYEQLASSGNDVTPVQWRAPFSIAFNCSNNAEMFPKHLYVGAAQDFKVDLNPWERGVIMEEFGRKDFIAWLRNLDRKPWSIEIPYQMSGAYLSLFPDLLVIRKDKHGYVFDLLEPHDPSRKDNYPKAKGLAEFARKHSSSNGRIQLIRKKRGGDGVEHYYRLDLSRIEVMRKVLVIKSNEELDKIFEDEASCEQFE